MKTTNVTKETAKTYGADALLTNKGNVGYKELSELNIGSGNSYDKEDIKIIVNMNGNKYGEYTSELDAKDAINNIVKSLPEILQ